MFSLRYTDPALTHLQKIPGKWRERIFRAISTLKEDPYFGKKLKGKLEGYYSLRIWPYRVIYTIRKQELLIVIIDIGHRQDIYR